MNTTLSPTTQWFAELASGQVEQTITAIQAGYIWFQGSFWKTELAFSNCRAVKPGEVVKVVGRHGIRLLVVPSEYVLPQQEQEARSSRYLLGVAQGLKLPLVDWLQKVGAVFAGDIRI